MVPRPTGDSLMSDLLAYVATLARTDAKFSTRDPRHLSISVFNYADETTALRAVDSMMLEGNVIAVTIEGPAGEVIFDWPMV